MARETVSEIMAGVQYVTKKKVANNTVLYTRPNGNKVVRLHRTDIVEFDRGGRIILRSGGWKTPTTKDRINMFLPRSIYLSQMKKKWYVVINKEVNDFFEGMVIDTGGIISWEDNMPKAVKFHRKLNIEGR